MAVPQIPYKNGNTQKGWKPEPTIYFYTRDRLGVKLFDALQGRFEGIHDRDTFQLGENCRGITIRMHVGCLSHRISNHSSSL